jgi:hypothetical protein
MSNITLVKKTLFMKKHFPLLVLFICATQISVAQKKTSSNNSKKNGIIECCSKQLYSGMKWRSIGPYQGGRSFIASGVVGNPLIYYFGATGGGIWKTVNGGITWVPI